MPRVQQVTENVDLTVAEEAVLLPGSSVADAAETRPPCTVPGVTGAVGDGLAASNRARLTSSVAVEAGSWEQRELKKMRTLFQEIVDALTLKRL